MEAKRDAFGNGQIPGARQDGGLDSGWAGAHIAVSAALLGVSLSFGDGNYSLRALLCMALSLAVCISGTLIRAPRFLGRPGPRMILWLPVICLMTQLFECEGRL